MAADPFETVDVHMHAWWTGGLEALFDPHALTTLDEQVFQDTLAQMDRLGIRPGVISGPNNVTAEWCRRASGRFVASWMPDPNPSDPQGEAARFTEAIEQQGFRGLGEVIMSLAGVPMNDDRFFSPCIASARSGTSPSFATPA